MNYLNLIAMALFFSCRIEKELNRFFTKNAVISTFIKDHEDLPSCCLGVISMSRLFVALY